MAHEGMKENPTNKKLMRVGRNDPAFITTIKAGQSVRNYKFT